MMLLRQVGGRPRAQSYPLSQPPGILAQGVGPQSAWAGTSGPSAGLGPDGAGPRAGDTARPAPRVLGLMPASLHWGQPRKHQSAVGPVSRPRRPQPLTGPGLPTFGGVTPSFELGCPGPLQAAAGEGEAGRGLSCRQSPAGATPRLQLCAPTFRAAWHWGAGTCRPLAACFVFGCRSLTRARVLLCHLGRPGVLGAPRPLALSSQTGPSYNGRKAPGGTAFGREGAALSQGLSPPPPLELDAGRMTLCGKPAHLGQLLTRILGCSPGQRLRWGML